MIRMGIEGTVRASFGLYNTKEEIDVLAAVLSVSAGCFDFSKRKKSPVIDKHYINGRLFCITRISVTSHKIRRNFSQDLPHLVTRYQASYFLRLLCSFLWAYSSSVENMLFPKNCPKNPSKVSAFS